MQPGMHMLVDTQALHQLVCCYGIPLEVLHGHIHAVCVTLFTHAHTSGCLHHVPRPVSRPPRPPCTVLGTQRPTPSTTPSAGTVHRKFRHSGRSTGKLPLPLALSLLQGKPSPRLLQETPGQRCRQLVYRNQPPWLGTGTLHTGAAPLTALWGRDHCCLWRNSCCSRCRCRCRGAP